MVFDGFNEVVQTHSQTPAICSNLAKEITARFKTLAGEHKKWRKTTNSYY